ncbi:MAG: hypothetical protein K0Q46_3669 [Rhodococcus erythropolis]|jgi:hypothetical protein|nr:hypothetical protein [Rhodococcus erythropolis]
MPVFLGCSPDENGHCPRRHGEEIALFESGWIRHSIRERRHESERRGVGGVRSGRERVRERAAISSCSWPPPAAVTPRCGAMTTRQSNKSGSLCSI